MEDSSDEIESSKTSSTQSTSIPSTTYSITLDLLSTLLSVAYLQIIVNEVFGREYSIRVDFIESAKSSSSHSTPLAYIEYSTT